MSNHKIPSSIAQTFTITKFELLNYFRSRRFIIMLGIGVIIGALLTLLVGHYRPSGFLTSSIDFYSSWWGTSATYIVILSGIFFGGDAISGEFQNKTGYFTVGNPIRRSSIYAGKWFAAFIASFMIIVAFLAITVLNNFYYFGFNMPYQFLESFLFTVLYLISVLGLTFFFSSLFKSSSIAILTTVVLMLFAFSLIQNLIDAFVHIEPWFLITYGAGIIGNILTVPYPLHTSTVHFGHVAITSYAVTVPEGIAILAAYFIVTAILGLVLFERKEFN
ncbi:MAG: ABC transporter permease [Nitrososphaerota archaeon]|jgi:ABC-2 type transport system permease protein|nr:ABC transporter permease [Nitrososphaerota archaeon]MDG6926861.1 ABC transporter permease [Nitrososphaerota archaeon]MDG6930021.1 ABC transporter permease [Nitrososphaerota archaeon]MDG6931972.1 ABC transporter permease [Nitrososphaerota archaeon]MDG6943825.1 ABC transporter permease [Nitrososphaerota archaeon]